MQKHKVICVGETMAMVTPTTLTSLADSETFTITPGGAEANVASHLVSMGFDALWVSRLGNDALGDRIARMLAQRGMNMSFVIRDHAASTGVYFKDPLPAGRRGVAYYRSASAASQMAIGDLERWPMNKATWVHTSGITAALSKSCSTLVEQIITDSKALGYGVSFDVNFRAALWPTREFAANRSLELGRQCQVILVGLDEAHELWGVSTAEQVADLFRTVPNVVVKDGGNEAVEILQTVDSRRVIRVPAQKVDIVEAVGAGDAFASAYLAGYLRDHGPEQRLAAGHARAAWTLGSLEDFRPMDRSTHE